MVSPPEPPEPLEPTPRTFLPPRVRSLAWVAAGIITGVLVSCVLTWVTHWIVDPHALHPRPAAYRATTLVLAATSLGAFVLGVRKGRRAFTVTLAVTVALGSLLTSLCWNGGTF
jgi:hypothetical protein